MESEKTAALKVKFLRIYMEDLLINHNEITLSKIESKLNETEEKFENL